MGTVHRISHPVISDKLSRMRDQSTSSAEFRRLLGEITVLLGYEATRDLATCEVAVTTPVEEAWVEVLADRAVTIVPVLRAGLAMTEGMLELLPFAQVGLIGLERDHETHRPREYCVKLPADVAESLAFVVDPMLATGGSAIDAVAALKDRGCGRIRLVCLLAAPEGIEAFQAAHPDVDLYVGAVDRRLNDDAYIVPGLGDAGDRIFGTD